MTIECEDKLLFTNNDKSRNKLHDKIRTINDGILYVMKENQFT